MRTTLAGKRILLLPRYTRIGSSSRLRLFQYEQQLRDAGATLLVEPLLDDDYIHRLNRGQRRDRRSLISSYRRRWKILSRLEDIDLIWAEKELLPFIPGFLERSLVRSAPPLVLDYDDATFHAYDQSPNMLVRKVLGKKLAPIIRHAAGITAGNDYIRDYVLGVGARRVLDVPTVVDLSRYHIDNVPSDGFIRIGWIGSPSTGRYLAPVIEAINRLRDRLPLKLMTVGIPKVDGLHAEQENFEWSEETEVDLLRRMDVGTMPLVDSPWERGKCGYKLIQYMACGKPVIASPVGVNQQIVTPDVGLFATTVDEWVRAISALSVDAGLRESLGSHGRLKVEREYSLQQVGPRVVDFFAELMDR